MMSVSLGESLRKFASQTAIIRDMSVIDSFVPDIPIDEWINHTVRAVKTTKATRMFGKKTRTEQHPKNKLEIIGKINKKKRKLEELLNGSE